MELVIVNNYNEMSRHGAEILAGLLADKPDASVIPAMGNTPMGLYKEIVEMRRGGRIDTSRLKIFQLDGYLGLEPNDPRSLTGWLRHTVIEPWSIDEGRFVAMPEDGVETEAACLRYDEKVHMAGGIDLAILGLGPNGHLGFNEPPSGLKSPTRVVPLTEESIKSNAVYWGGEDRVPRSSITAGMDILFDARHIILLVNGAHKKEILQKTIHDQPNGSVPSSYLQLHPNVTIIADKSAYS